MNLWERALDLLFPPKCPYCQRILDDPRASVCPDCRPKLPWLEGKAGERRIDFADGCFSSLAYQDAVPQAVQRYKFSRVRALRAPLARKRLRERGFNQAELLAREVGRLLSIPAGPALEKTRDTRPQSELEEGSARRANARGAYALLPGTGLAGKRVVLVDDVVTSGATLSECAALLRQAGAEEIFCLTLARARGD